MKTTKIKIPGLRWLLAVTIVLYSFAAFAQQGKTGHGKPADQPGGKHEKIEVQKIAFITQQVDFTPDEAKVFWPVYNEYEAKRHELKKSFKSTEGTSKPDFEKITEKEASQILDNDIAEAQRLMDLRKEYAAKFRSILPDVKVLKLQYAEREFQKMLIDKLREHKQHPPVQKPK